ncbi:MAG: amylo-alpha-1,6-glucosidase, partial [Methanospirillum sp.]|nr:amylo-alpha-1,6-glucosidase [Methanospirillum sp.]
MNPISWASELEKVPEKIRYGSELQHVDTASSREFLLTDGKYLCSSSFAGNTRRYHGLCIDRNTIVLSSLHETMNGISLLPGWWGKNLPETLLRHLISACLYPVIQEFVLPGVFVRKTISLDQGLTIRWDLEGEADCTIRPLVSFRNMHEIGTGSPVSVTQGLEGLNLNGYPFGCTLPFTPDNQVYYNTWYPAEAKRGYDALENLVSPGFFSGTVQDDTILLTIGYKPGEYPDVSLPPDSAPDLLDRASRLCLREDDIIAGYHWFAESWGRDTFISLPGLLLSYGRFREAESVFRMYLKHQKGGIIPNRIPDSYHSSDATLWFFWSIFRYMQKNPGSRFVKEISPGLENLISSYPDSSVASLDGDLITVAPGSTWMDTSFTPRAGKPVEINALWILALEICEYQEIGVPVTSKNARNAFSAFWNENTRCLYDLLDPCDASVRPNQVIALALGLIPFDEGRIALDQIRKTLLTPYGLRTLAPGSPGYHGTYCGDPSYHNGMVWPWLTAWYLDALAEYGESRDTVSWPVISLWNHMYTDGAGMVPEFFDGDAPYHPGGSVCQAWSIAELIRA